MLILYTGETWCLALEEHITSVREMLKKCLRKIMTLERPSWQETNSSKLRIESNYLTLHVTVNYNGFSCFPKYYYLHLSRNKMHS